MNKTIETASLKKALESARKRLPVPHELSQKPAENELLALIDKIEAVNNTTEIISLSHTLKVSELRLVFPALSHEKAQKKEIQDRLFIIIRERACHTMYNTAWNCFQVKPDDQLLQKALALLCNILQIKLETSQDLTFSNILKPGPAKFDPAKSDLKSGTLPLISELAAPDSKNFIKRLSIVLAERNYVLQSFFRDYGILPESALAADLVSQSFINRQHFTLNDRKLFNSSLETASAGIQSNLIESLLLARDTSPDVFDEYCRIIYKKFGRIEDGNPIWANIKESAKSVYRHWAITAAIRTHCRTNPAKNRFYSRYFDFINSIEAFSDDTLLIYFDSFVIADNRKSLDTAMYYEGSQASEHPIEIIDSEEIHKDPASHAIPHITCEQAIMASSASGPVILYFNQTQIKNSSAFIDFCLQRNKGTLNNLKTRFFHR